MARLRTRGSRLVSRAPSLASRRAARTEELEEIRWRFQIRLRTSLLTLDPSSSTTKLRPSSFGRVSVPFTIPWATSIIANPKSSCQARPYSKQMEGHVAGWILFHVMHWTGSIVRQRRLLAVYCYVPPLARRELLLSADEQCVSM